MRHANVAIFVPHAGCPHQCSFCNQRSISGSIAVPRGPEVVQPCREGLANLGAGAAHSQIAFFGGSFTAVPRDYMTELLEAAAPFVGEGGFSGIRISTRPDAITPEILDTLARYGVDTIELGVQSMVPEVLERNGRGHTPKQVTEAASLIQERGFTLGLQMMLGLDGDSPEGAWHTARAIADLKPDQVRIYPTLVIAHTPLAERLAQGSYRPMELDEAVDLSAQLLKFFTERGIAVIRLGLHASRDLERDLLAGPYHPAFRELCESRLLWRELDTKLAEQRITDGSIVISVHPKNRSRLAGQRKHNLIRLAELGYTVRIEEDPELEGLTLRVRQDG